MNIKLRKGKSASTEKIEALEEELGYEISLPVRSFLRLNDGAVPENNICKQYDSCGVTGFIPSARIGVERRNLENLPSNAYPIAWAEGGNYVFVDEGSGGSVFFWDHELPKKVVKLADNFDSFLEQLEPFDVNSIQLKPGQVKSVWVDPEFLKKLKGPNH